MNLLWHLLFFLAITISVLGNGLTTDEKIVVVTGSYKNAHLLKIYFDSIVKQTYKNYGVLYVADNDYTADSDGTGLQAEEFVKKNYLENRIKVIRNRDRQLALKNIYKASLSCNDEDIIAILDGDDHFAHYQVFEQIRNMYANPDRPVWATYGNFKYLSTSKPCSWTKQIPADVITNNNIRQWGNGPTHLKTVKAWLMKEIKIQDLFFEGDFFTSAYDIALFEPIYEMIGERFDWTQEVLYVYNDVSPLNDHKIDRSLQIRLDHFIRSKPPYQRLAQSQSGRLESLKAQNRLKADVLIFATDYQQIQQVLCSLAAQLKNTQKIIVFTPESCIYTAPEDANTILRTFPLHTLPTVVEALTADYVLFLDASQEPPSLDITEALIWLEKTHAHAFYTHLDKNSFSMLCDSKKLIPVQISLEDEQPHTTYAWQYQNSEPGLTTGGALMRKKDVDFIVNMQELLTIEQLDQAWNANLNKEHVGLFYQESSQ